MCVESIGLLNFPLVIAHSAVDCFKLIKVYHFCLSAPYHFYSATLLFLYLFLNCIFRGLFIIDDKGVLRQITMNDLPVSLLHLSAM